MLASADLLQFLMPTLKADFTLCDTYVYTEQEPLNCPIHIFAGTADPEAPPAVMEAWRQHSSVDTQMHVFQAGHFFIRTDFEHVVDTLRTILPLSQTGMANTPHA